jgi:polyisoprenoid-binding protein YceI
MKRFTFALIASALLPLAAQGAEFNQIQAASSSILFAYKQMGVAMDGKFRKFSAQLSFDPAKPAAAKAAFDVELASIDTGSREADDEVASKSWFNSKAFPTARFVSSNVKALGDNRYEVAGKLTIKGQTLDVIIPATFATQGKSGVFDGSFSIRRGDFAIGEGAWAKFDIVANEIQIKFHILAAAANSTGK